jgi:hypothetical protein
MKQGAVNSRLRKSRECLHFAARENRHSLPEGLSFLPEPERQRRRSGETCCVLTRMRQM